MVRSQDPYVLSVDDDPVIQGIIEGLLKRWGCEVICVGSAREAMEQIHKKTPGLILLDVLMPEIDGYEFCYHLQENNQTAHIPVIFLTGLESQQDKKKAFSVGGVDYLTKPVDGELLWKKVQVHLQVYDHWSKILQGPKEPAKMMDLSDFHKFKKILVEKFNPAPQLEKKLSFLSPLQIHSLSSEFGISNRQLAIDMAEFLQVPYLPQINADEVSLGVLPTRFCKNYSVIPVKGKQSEFAFVLSNPFNWELTDTLKKFTRQSPLLPLEILVTESENIESFFQGNGKNKISKPQGSDGLILNSDNEQKSTPRIVVKKTDESSEIYPIHSITNHLLGTAVKERASDIHIEPKENETTVRLRIDGDMTDFLTLGKTMGGMLISRLKALAEMDIAERRKPQDGSVDALIHQKNFKLRLATTSTPNGESLIARILEPGQKPRDLQDLGMGLEQMNLLKQFAGRNQGLVLVVGPVGSGKTTTIYSLISQIDCQTRSLISVEDPVEYRIPFANQQQVNLKAGVTFEALLKSSVRQDPNVLFIGEIRDPYSAKIAMDFASTGHLTITTLHTSNATTAIFRLERLEISRETMADAILATVAQRLLKKLCPFCKRTEPITQAEIDQIAPFTQEIPTHTAHPVGCAQCNQTGYSGREAIHEVIHWSSEVSEMIRTGCPISEIREFVYRRGDQLISQRAVDKVKSLIFPVKMVYEKVLVEENLPGLMRRTPKESPVFKPLKDNREPTFSILLVEDDLTTQKSTTRSLESEGYRVVVADDGVDALIKIGQSCFDLILSDINTPNLDGFKLLEMVQQKGFKTPVILMTASTDPEYETKGFELGAADFLKKPVQKESLLLRIGRILQNLERREPKICSL